MSDKLLTVIVPSYNMEEYLPKCLGSLLVPVKDMLQRLEVIVVNDGSTDRTSEIAHDFEKRYPGVFRVIDKANGNYGSCINAALPEANGFYVKVLDADDSVDTESFGTLCESLAEEIEKKDSAADLVVTDYVTVNENGMVIGTTTYPFPQGSNHTLDEMASGEMRFTIHSIVYRRMLPMEIGYWQTEGISYTDTEWIIEPMIRVRSVRYISIPVTRYLLGRSGQTMEKATFVSNFHQMETIAEGLASRFETRLLQCLPEATKYYKKQVLRVVSSIYWVALFGIDGHPVAYDLSAFDIRIKRFEQLFASVGNVRFPSRRFPVQYVALWRKGGSFRYVLILFLRIFLWTRRILSKRNIRFLKEIRSPALCYVLFWATTHSMRLLVLGIEVLQQSTSEGSSAVIQHSLLCS